MFLNDVHNNIDNKKQCCTVFIDFSKAFDSINHIILLDKLKFQYNFSNKSFSLIRSYLSNCSQKVQINKVLSNCLDIKAVVPQGILLGPILFLIYINDIYASIPDASVYLYADDLTLVFCDDDKNSLINKVNEN